MSNPNRIYETKKAEKPKKISERSASLVYSSQAHRMLLYAKFRAKKGFTRDDWTRFHPDFKMRSHPKECLDKLLKYGLIEFVQERKDQRFFITSRGELKLIHMAEAQQEKVRKELIKNAQHLTKGKS
jgi:hypothetical protein